MFKKSGLIVVILAALYSALGFLALPTFVTQKTIEVIQELYGVQAQIEKISFNPFSFEVEVQNLTIPGLTEAHERLNLGHLYANLEIFPLIKKEIRLASISLSQTHIDFRFLKNGETNWTTPKTTAQPTDTSESSWVLTLDQIDIQSTTFKFSDYTHENPLELPLGPINLKAEHISTSFGAQTNLQSLDISLGANGFISLSGTTSLKPATAQIRYKASQIPMGFLSSYLSNKTYLDVASGLYNGDGRIEYQNGLLHFQTDSHITDFKIIHKPTKQSIAKWQNLKIRDLQFQLAPMTMQIEEAQLNGFSSGLILKKNGKLNYHEFLKPSRATNSNTVTKELSKTKKSPLDISIKKLNFNNSKIFFTDKQIKPNFSAQITNLNGSVGPLTSQLNQKMLISLNGRVDAAGKFKASGFYRATPQKPELDLKMSFNNIEMTTFSPYAGKFAGYEISKGKLFLDLHYTLKNRLIRGSNKAELDQFTLGHRVDSEEAIGLPVKLALALLKDRDGKIKITLPVEGDVESPNFKFSDLIWTAVKNVIINIAAAPFDFLKSLMGGDDHMDSIAFTVGTADILPEQQPKIQQLAQFLMERPNLTLEIQGRLLAADKEALQKTLRRDEISDEQFKNLTNSRATKVLLALQSANVEAERLYTLAPTPEEKPEIGPRVLLILKNRD